MLECQPAQRPTLVNLWSCLQSVTLPARLALGPLIKTAGTAEMAGKKTRRKPALVRNISLMRLSLFYSVTLICWLQFWALALKTSTYSVSIYIHFKDNLGRDSNTCPKMISSLTFFCCTAFLYTMFLDIDECSKDPSPCKDKEYCLNTDGSYSCNG